MKMNKRRGLQATLMKDVTKRDEGHTFSYNALTLDLSADFTNSPSISTVTFCLSAKTYQSHQPYSNWSSI